LTSSGSGKTAKIQMSYPRDAVKQYLDYGSMYDEGLKK
jgi:hypothetical protein